jgi:hypothetical protein
VSTIAQSKPPGRFDLLEMSFFHLLQHLQPFPLSRTQLNSIRSVSIPPPTRDETGHFYFAQTGHSHFAPIQL